MTQKIKYAKIKNFKGIKELEVDNLSRFVAVFGQNGAGKSSFLDAIKSAIKLEKWGNDKVRIGEKNGEIEVHFEDFKIKRIVGQNGKLEVEHDGQLVQRPQAWLDGIFMGVIGDPQKFLSLQRKDKIRYILETHGKKEAYDELEKERLVVWDERKELHRKTLAKEEEIKDVNVSELEDVGLMPDVEELQNELKEAEEHNKTYYDLESRKQRWEAYVNELKREKEVVDGKISDWESLIEELERKLKAAKESLQKNKEESAELDKKHKIAQEVLAEIKGDIESFDKKDTDSINAKIKEAYEEKEKAAKSQAKIEMYQADKQKAKELRAQRKEKDEEVKQIEEKQNQLVKDINISYDVKVEEWVMSVMIDEMRVPLDDLNTAAQLDLGVDICLNWPNKVKILTIENANALDPKTMERIKAKIEEKEGQCFLETVYQTWYESITIEDGEVVL